MPIRRPAILVSLALLLMSVVMLSGDGARAVGGDEQPIRTERDLTTAVKASIVFNMIAFTEWPQDRFEDTDDERSPIVIGIMGIDQHGFEPFLERISSSQRVHDRHLVVRRFRFPQPRDPEAGPDAVDEEALEAFFNELRQTHLLFVARSEWDNLFRGERRHRTVLRALRGGHDVLTVSDLPRFAEDGGMIGMAIRENRWALDSNLRAIRESNLRLSSRFLGVTRVVERPERAN